MRCAPRNITCLKWNQKFLFLYTLFCAHILLKPVIFSKIYLLYHAHLRVIIWQQRIVKWLHTNLFIIKKIDAGSSPHLTEAAIRGNLQVAPVLKACRFHFEGSITPQLPEFYSRGLTLAFARLPLSPYCC